MPINLNKHYNLGELTYEQVDSNWDNVEGAVNTNEQNIADRAPLSRWNATGNPGANNDQTQGYRPGSKWYNQNTDTLFVNTSAATGNAQWVEITDVSMSLGSLAFLNESSNIAWTGNNTFSQPVTSTKVISSFPNDPANPDDAATYGTGITSVAFSDTGPEGRGMGVLLSVVQNLGRGFQIFQDGTAADAPLYKRSVHTALQGGLGPFTQFIMANVSGNTTTPGDLSVSGVLSKSSGSFSIEHPHPDKKDTRRLVHSFIEGPKADLIYRGRADLVDGQATVDVDASAGMTPGTFELLCRDVQVWVQNESGWDKVRGSVTGSTLDIECENAASTDTVSWLVIGERQDPHMIAADWTDEEGHVIVEPLIPEPEPEPQEFEE